MTLARASVTLLALSWLAGCEATVSELDPSEEVPAPLPPSSPPPAPSSPGNRAPAIDSFGCDPASGEAPLPSVCRWQVSDPDGQPVRCTLDVSGDDRPEYEVFDCRAVGDQAHLFGASGTQVVTLTAIDSAGATAVASATVIVGVPQNRAPVISTFTATPPTGLVPLAAALSWSISDSDGDPLSCEVDIGADGSAEYRLPSCTSASTQGHTFATPGGVGVVLTVTDARGLSISKGLSVKGQMPGADVRITRFEWGQSVISGNPRLIEGKPALLRLYVLADTANLSGVEVKAEGFRGGESLGALPLTGPATPPTAEDPSNLSQQFRGTVPDSWVGPGLEIRIAVDPANTLLEPDETNNTLTVIPVVGKPTVLPVTSVPVVQQGMVGTPQNLLPILKEMWPVKDVDVVVRAPYTSGQLLSGGATAGWSGLLNEIASVRQADGSGRFYYGWVKVNYLSGVAGVGYIGQAAATGRDDSLSTAAHELGHNMGRRHAPCGGASGADAAFPYVGAKIGSWGWNSISQRLVSPSTTYDLMSYCGPSWVSDYNYRAVQSFLEANVQSQPFIQGAEGEFLVVSGTLGPDGATLRPLQRVVTRAEPPRAGPYSLRLWVGARTVEVPFDVQEVADLEAEGSPDGFQAPLGGRPGPPSTAHFSFLVPYEGPVRAMTVSRGSQLLGTKVAGAMATSRPEVSVAEQEDRLILRWDARQFPYAMIAHLGEAGRTTLALWLEGGWAEVRTDGLPPGGQFELGLSDGVNAIRQTLLR